MPVRRGGAVYRNRPSDAEVDTAAPGPREPPPLWGRTSPCVRLVLCRCHFLCPTHWLLWTALYETELYAKSTAYEQFQSQVNAGVLLHRCHAGVAHCDELQGLDWG
jgi:hypothetical protein